jgi:hypothetical protein
MSFLKKLFKKSIVQEAEKAKTWFDEVHIGSIACKNRVFMSPLTRMRGNP